MTFTAIVISYSIQQLYTKWQNYFYSNPPTPSPSTPVTRPMRFSAHCTDLYLGVSFVSSGAAISVVKNILKSKQHKMRCIIIYSCKLDHVSSLLPGPAQFLISPGIKAKVLTMDWKTCHPCPALWVSPLPLCCHPNAAPVQGGPFAVPPARQALCIGYILCF